MAQRVADLFADSVSPTALVAFTFTERAADELKHRIEQRVEARLGKDFIGKLNGCFVGTIHSYCFRLLQQHVAMYETYDVLDDNRLAALLTRVSNNIGLKELEGQLFRSLKAFVRNMDVVDNELIPTSKLTSPFRDVLKNFHEELKRYRFLTYGQVIARAVEELGRPDVFNAVHNELRHLIVDEYQDINPAQEALIELLAKRPVELCVVGDDDQSIYQWRGSDVNNIIQFGKRYKNVQTFSIVKNLRSRPQIVKAANDFARTIADRLPKSMEQYRDGTEHELVTWRATNETLEATQIAQSIKRLNSAGFRYGDVAVLVRSSTSYEKLLDAFKDHDIPVQPGGRTGLFMQPDAQLFGQTFAYLADHEWRSEEYGTSRTVSIGTLVEQYKRLFQLSTNREDRVRKRVKDWKAEVSAETEPANLIRDYYDLLADCGVADWNFNDQDKIARLGSLARCSAILVDYESVRRRSRPNPNSPGEAVGGQDRGEWYYRWLAIHIQNWALGVFEDFEGEEEFTLDAVDLTTVHKAKGLEWPVVFVPSLSAKRFPSSKTGSSQTWYVPEQLFDKRRYEGTENDERRLFYVAITRARDWLSLSTHDTPNKQRVAPSPFIREIADGDPDYVKSLDMPPAPNKADVEDNLLSITFSELAEFKSCGLAYRLRSLIGFQPPLAPELGYGKAVHHIMRNVAEYTQRHKRAPSPDQLDFIFDNNFYLPAANKPAHQQMKASARRLVDKYVAQYGEELNRVWAVERPFELHLDNAVISGRADVILEEDKGQVTALAIVDYKTAADDEEREYESQLQIYTNAGRREGLEVRAAYVHDLKAGDRIRVDVAPERVRETELKVVHLVEQLKSRQYVPNPGTRCKRCDVKAICRHAA